MLGRVVKSERTILALAGGSGAMSAFAVMGGYFFGSNRDAKKIKSFALSAVIPITYACTRTPKLYKKSLSRGLTLLNDLTLSTVVPLIAETMGVWLGTGFLITYFDHATKWPREGFKKVIVPEHPVLAKSRQEGEEPPKIKYFPRFETISDGVLHHAESIGAIVVMTGILGVGGLLMSAPVTLSCGFICVRFGIKRVMKL